MTQLRIAGRIPEWDLADRMRRALRDSDLSAADIAEQIGVRREAVSTWINGRREPSRATVMLWAQLTGVDAVWLETGQGPASWPDPGTSLPRLDSNQQPSGYLYALVSEVSDVPARRAA